MRKKIINLNEEFSINCNASVYSDIVLENYFQYKSLYEKIINSDDAENEYFKNSDSMQKNYILCFVFSQMCIESLLNDYVRDFIEKDITEEIFDKLNIKQKLMFISKMFYYKPLDKSKLLYSSIDKVSKIRNKLVHNKSEFLRYESIPENYDKINIIDDIKQEFNDVITSVKAIIEVAKFLENDKNEVYTVERLFLCEIGKENEQRNRIQAIKDFHIKISID